MHYQLTVYHCRHAAEDKEENYRHLPLSGTRCHDTSNGQWSTTNRVLQE